MRINEGLNGAQIALINSAHDFAGMLVMSLRATAALHQEKKKSIYPRQINWHRPEAISITYAL